MQDTTIEGARIIVGRLCDMTEMGQGYYCNAHRIHGTRWYCTYAADAADELVTDLMTMGWNAAFADLGICPNDREPLPCLTCGAGL